MKRYQTGGPTTTASAIDPLAGAQLGASSSLSPWAGPYVTEMLGKGAALADMPYQAYMGPLTAGPSTLQEQAFTGLAGLATTPATTAGTFTAPGVAQQYMSPYMEAALEPQIAEARRQAEIQRVQQAGRLSKAGAYGGGRQAIMESELDRNLLRSIADIYGTGMQRAYEAGADLFGQERAYGLGLLGQQLGAGGTQRDIEQAGVAADIAQFEQERDFPYKQVQYMQSLLQGLPISTQTYQYAEPTGLSQAMGGAGGIISLLQSLKLI